MVSFGQEKFEWGDDTEKRSIPGRNKWESLLLSLLNSIPQPVPPTPVPPISMLLWKRGKSRTRTPQTTQHWNGGVQGVNTNQYCNGWDKDFKTEWTSLLVQGATQNKFSLFSPGDGHHHVVTVRKGRRKKRQIWQTDHTKSNDVVGPTCTGVWESAGIGISEIWYCLRSNVDILSISILIAVNKLCLCCLGIMFLLQVTVVWF